MSLTSYQAAPPCNKGEGKVLRAPKSVNAFPYLRRTLISALPTSESSSARVDRKSTRLNSSHLVISYAVFCLKKKFQGAPLGAPRGGGAVGESDGRSVRGR